MRAFKVVRLRTLFVLMSILVGASGCAASLPRPISGVVRELGGPDCPEDRIVVVDSRIVDHDTVYVLDACGTVIEVERGLAVPTRRSEVSEISPETPFEEPDAMRLDVPEEVVAVVRDKVRRWCTLETAGAQDPDAIAFPNATPAKQKECQDVVARAVIPLGMEEEAADSAIYRFRMDRFLFTVREAIYLAPCEHRVSEASRRACQCKDGAGKGCPGGDRATKQVSVEAIKTGTGGEEDGVRKERSWFGSIQLGLGFLANDAPGRAAESLSFTVRAEAGVKATPHFGVAFVTGNDIGLEVSEDRPVLYHFGVGGVLYPVTDSGFRLDATAAAAPFGYDFEGVSDVGALFGGGVGYYPRERTKKGSWTSFSLALRGFYSMAEDRETVAGMLQGGMHVW